MADFDNLFDAAIARADETIRGYMGTSATMTSGEQSGAVIRGVFDDPENISYAGQGVRVEGSSPSLFVRTDEVRQLRRGDTLTIGEENFWVDRVSPDDGGSCHLWLGRGVPPAGHPTARVLKRAGVSVEVHGRHHGRPRWRRGQIIG